ncbi:hypothetical protein HB364_28570 [Pseudoflavitalea sp. X16]|uniref:PKD-like family lipoprotein n=1 Tax=Paraflavitalea devenefica TaxID=2716334 RepID=UPI00142476F9|nr:PKD-like family lipoprotein [Paraflavitalea devenefica]NII29067.1 hypothetical protein [Paraflavitalea devenefica]
MRTVKYICYCIAALLLLGACHKDKGNYTYHDVPALYVDTAGTQTRFEVFQSQDKVTINPKLIYDGNASQLSHLWRLYVATNVFDTLSRYKQIDVTIPRPPGTYTLEYEAVDSTGRKALMQYTVVVVPPIPSGWMVAYETAAGNTDVDVIRAPEFITGVKDTVMRNVYSKRNGATMPGKPVAIYYLTTAFTHLYTDKTGEKLQNTDFGFVQNYQQMFLLGNPPATPAPQGFYPGSFNGGMLIDNGGVYWTSENSYVGKVTVDAKGYEAAPFIYTQYAKQGGFYDQLNRRFVVIEQQTSQASLYPNADATARFNLNNIGKQLLYIERGFGENPSPAVDPYKYSIFKDVSGNGRYLYVINFQKPATPDVAAVDITTAPDIQDAQYFAVSNLGPAMLYATAQKVYNFQVNTASNTISTPAVAFQAPAGEAITCMRLLKGMATFGTGGILPDMDSRFLYIATWDAAAGTGKVYLYAANITSGQLGAAPLKVWTVGGKVGDMNYKRS